MTIKLNKIQKAQDVDLSDRPTVEEVATELQLQGKLYLKKILTCLEVYHSQISSVTDIEKMAACDGLLYVLLNDNGDMNYPGKVVEVDYQNDEVLREWNDVRADNYAEGTGAVAVVKKANDEKVMYIFENGAGTSDAFTLNLTTGEKTQVTINFLGMYEAIRGATVKNNKICVATYDNFNGVGQIRELDYNLNGLNAVDITPLGTNVDVFPASLAYYGGCFHLVTSESNSNSNYPYYTLDQDYGLVKELVPVNMINNADTNTNYSGNYSNYYLVRSITEDKGNLFSANKNDGSYGLKVDVLKPPR